MASVLKDVLQAMNSTSTIHLSNGSWAGQVLRLKVGGQWHTDLSLTLSEPDSHQVVYSDKEDTDPLPLLC